MCLLADHPATHDFPTAGSGDEDVKNRLFAGGDVHPLVEWTEDNVMLALKKKGDLLSLFLCFFFVSSMASNLPVDRSPCATASDKYTCPKNKIRGNRKKGSNSKVGRTVVCIFGLKSQLSGKHGVDCLVCVGYSSPHSSVTDKQGSKLFVSARIQV